MQRPEIFQGEGMLLDRHEMKPLAALRIGAPGLPGREEIEPETEAGLEDDEAAAAAPALRQPVALQEDVPRLPEAAAGAVLDVAEGLRPRRAVVGEGGAGGCQDRGAHAPVCVRFAAPL